MIGKTRNFNKFCLRLKIEVVSMGSRQHYEAKIKINLCSCGINEDDCFDPDRHAAPVVMAVMGPAKHLFLAKLLSK